MRLLRMLPERWQRLVPEMTKFAVIGVINTAVDIAILNALLWIGPVKAKAIATIVATTLSYALNRYWTFAQRQRSSAYREYLMFFALNMIGFAIQTAPIAFAKYGLGFSEKSPELADWLAFNIANIVGTFLGMLFRFWSYRRFVFTTPVEVVGVPAGPAGDAPATAGAVPLATADTTDDEFVELTGPLVVERLAAELDLADSELDLSESGFQLPEPGYGEATSAPADPTLLSGERTRSLG